ncbi:MAG: glycosyltransferase family 2 protein [Verrucomicrobiota bacterium]
MKNLSPQIDSRNRSSQIGPPRTTPALQPPSLAMVMCVHDEASFLPANLAWHHAVGVEKAYLFLDHCTDHSEAIARDHPWVDIIPRDHHPDIRFMREYQNQCVDIAFDRARQDGFDWLLHLDADELAFGGLPRAEKPNTPQLSPFERLVNHLSGRLLTDALKNANLPRMLAQLDPDTQQVILRTHETIPTPVAHTAAFWHNAHFQSGDPIPQQVLDPLSGKTETVTRYLGHNQGKAIARTRANLQTFNQHRFTTNQNVPAPNYPEEVPIPTEYVGAHFHYPIVSPEQWLKKFRQFAAFSKTWSSGVGLPFPRRAWREVSLTMNETEAADYLDRGLFHSPAQLDRLTRENKIQFHPEVPLILSSLLSATP